MLQHCHETHSQQRPEEGAHLREQFLQKLSYGGVLGRRAVEKRAIPLLLTHVQMSEQAGDVFRPQSIIKYRTAHRLFQNTEQDKLPLNL